MEFIKNISFNTDKLLENTKVKISYAGYLFEENSENVYFHYGFGWNWDNLSEIKMEKTDIGFQAEINILESDKLNFCFRNSNYVWDNNFGNNFSVNIEKCEEDDNAVETIVEEKEEVKEEICTAIALYNDKNVVLKFIEKIGMATVKLLELLFIKEEKAEKEEN